MLIIITENYAMLSVKAARVVARAIRKDPALKLGLATGKTPLGMYQELVRLHREENLNFSKVITFNLDEYLGVSRHDPHSFRQYMHKHLVDRVNIRPENFHIPDGSIQSDFEKHCDQYEDEIRDAGGIDLQVLGIGKTGHIGFNEPASSLASRTRVKTLTRETLEENRWAKSFGSDESIPPCAITMGIGTILEARKILLLASGAGKAEAVARAIEGPITASVTASALQLHPDVTVVVDEEAASGLAHRDYYRRILQMTKKLTPERAE